MDVSAVFPAAAVAGPHVAVAVASPTVDFEVVLAAFAAPESNPVRNSVVHATVDQSVFAVSLVQEPWWPHPGQHPDFLFLWVI